MLRVLVAEDSPTARELLVGILQSAGDLQVVGLARDGAEAVDLARRLRPDVITMDVHMPVLDGLEATREIMALAPTPIVIVSSDRSDDAALSLSATDAGALMVVPKPVGPDSPAFEDHRDYLQRMVRAMAGVSVVQRRRRDGAPAAAERIARLPALAPRLVAIGASTGGPPALRRILSDLPADFPVPILVVQHMARGFTRGLADWLNSTGRLHVRVAEEGEPLLPRTVYLAPENYHLGVGPGPCARLSTGAPVGLFRPSATHLFESVAAACGGAAVAVVLTGMGSDGVAGLQRLHRAGGRVLAQDEASSVVFGMAREAVRAGVVDAVLPLEEIATQLTTLVTAEEANG